MTIKFLNQDRTFSSVEFTDGVNSFVPTKGIQSKPEAKDYWTVKLPEWTGRSYFKLTQCWAYLDSHPEAIEMEMTTTRTRTTGGGNGTPTVANESTVEKALGILEVYFRDDEEAMLGLMELRDKVEARHKEVLRNQRDQLEELLAKIKAQIGD